MYDEAGKKLAACMAEYDLTHAGPWSVLYFMWDEAAGKAEIGISFPIAAGDEMVHDPEMMIVDIPKSKAAMDTLCGPYTGLGKVHEGLMRYAAEKGLGHAGMPVMAIEEYAIDPMGEHDPNNWVTNVYYLHK